VRVHFTPDGWEEFLFWRTDATAFEKVIGLIQEICRDPFKGTGKPEPLKKPLSGLWSRHINQEHRIVYHISGKGDGQNVTIVRCKGHY
jgi:toxin YoeB